MKNEDPGDPTITGVFLVEAAGFEPVAFASRTQRSTKLSYASIPRDKTGVRQAHG